MIWSPRRETLITRSNIITALCFFSAITTLEILRWNFRNFTVARPSLSGCEGFCKSERKRVEELANKLEGADSLNGFFRKQTTRKEERTFRTKTMLITNAVCLHHYFLLILVSSAPSNFQTRKNIRQTWAVDTAITPRWKTVFLVAQSRVKEESDALLRESDSYGDLVRGEYIDHYWNQTFKIQMGFEWAVRQCNFSFLLKMDDDAFVHTKMLMSVLMNPNTSRELLYLGMLWEKPMVKRGKEKWTISYEEYNKTVYPDFCPGFGYVLSHDVVDTFVDLFDDVPAFRFDDVYVGMLAERAGVNGTFHPGFRQYPSPPKVACSLDETVFVWHGITGNCLLKLFKDTF